MWRLSFNGRDVDKGEKFGRGIMETQEFMLPFQYSFCDTAYLLSEIWIMPEKADPT